MRDFGEIVEDIFKLIPTEKLVKASELLKELLDCVNNRLTCVE